MRDSHKAQPQAPSFQPIHGNSHHKLVFLRHKWLTATWSTKWRRLVNWHSSKWMSNVQLSNINTSCHITKAKNRHDRQLEAKIVIFSFVVVEGMPLPVGKFRGAGSQETAANGCWEISSRYHHRRETSWCSGMKGGDEKKQAERHQSFWS